MSLIMNKPSDIGIVSAEERRNRFIAKLAKAEGAVVVAEDDLASDAARAVKAPEEKLESAGNLAILSHGNVVSAKSRVKMLESALDALDIVPEASDVKWARENVAKVSKLMRLVPRGVGRANGIVKAIRDLRKLDAK